jgi:hypothetical protein
MAANQMMAGGDADGHSAMDYPAHLATYRFFTHFIKWGAIGVAFCVLLLAFLTL